jgi:polyisoprenoid-binding protein YceI
MGTATRTASTTTTIWSIDPAHSNVEFAVKHLMISTVKGRFGINSGTLRLNEADPGTTSVEIEIDAASVDTRQEQRDTHLRSADFFDTEQHPKIVFRSTRIDGDISGDFTVVGDLTIKNITRPVTLKATFEGEVRDPWGGERLGFSAEGKINRKEFDLSWNQALEAGGWVVGDDIKLRIDAEFVKQKS